MEEGLEKPIIGIISNRSLGEENRPFTFTTSFSNVVCEKVAAFGGIPAGIIFPGGTFSEEYVRNCDGFIFQGGSRIELCQLLAMDFANKNRYPTLGICNGLQTMAGYEFLLKNSDSFNGFKKVFNEYGEDGFIELVQGHNKENPFYIQNIERAKHIIKLKEESYLAHLYQSTITKGVSLHNYACKNEVFDKNKAYIVVGRSEDGVIEAIEGTNGVFNIGVQYHVELDGENDAVISGLVRHAKLAKNIFK